jgi:O-methyltransferase
MLTLAQRGVPCAQLDLKSEKDLHPDIIEDEFWSIVPLVWDYTELSIAVLYNLYCASKYVINVGIEGDFVECGVHLGGSVMMMEHVLLNGDKNPDRRIFALDTFFGFVGRNEELDIDIQTGLPVCIPQTNADDFSKGAIDNMMSVGFSRLNVVKGDVLQNIPTLDVKKISLLRLDTDTYETTKFELDNLYDRVAVGGVVIIDDYGYTFGCKKAVDDFISSKKVMLQRINRFCRAWVKIAE